MLRRLYSAIVRRVSLLLSTCHTPHLLLAPSSPTPLPLLTTTLPLTHYNLPPPLSLPPSSSLPYDSCISASFSPSSTTHSVFFISSFSWTPLFFLLLLIYLSTYLSIYLSIPLAPLLAACTHPFSAL